MNILLAGSRCVGTIGRPVSDWFTVMWTKIASSAAECSSLISIWAGPSTLRPSTAMVAGTASTQPANEPSSAGSAFAGLTVRLANTGGNPRIWLAIAAGFAMFASVSVTVGFVNLTGVVLMPSFVQPGTL